MLPPLEIFHVESDGHLLWKAAAETLEAARRRVKILMASDPPTTSFTASRPATKPLFALKS
jgi:hypothetical protein